MNAVSTVVEAERHERRWLINLDDVPAFVLALVNRATYDATYPFVNEESAGDVSLNGVFDLGDIGELLPAILARLNIRTTENNEERDRS